MTIVRGIHQKLENQLVMKFQFAHLTAIHGKPFNLYSDRANLVVEKNITKRLNDGTIRCYSAYYDGSSTEKTMDEKELFIIKTARKDEVKFSIMSLEESEEANPERLKLALENLILKLGLNIERKNKGIFLSFLHSENCEKKYLFLAISIKNFKKILMST